MMSEAEGCVLLIVGPTASGKTELSIRIAERCNGEIVSADSRQVYRFMDVGTDKLPEAERERIPHHCIDIRNPDEYFSAGEYARVARSIIQDIFSRGRIPIVVGGSGLYIRALVDGVFAGNYRDSKIREKLINEANEKGLETLHKRLYDVDSQAAEKIHPNDRKRLIRALEVYEITGLPISKIQKEKTEPADFDSLFWGLRWSREVIYRRIEERVDRMMEGGLVEEVKRLREMGYGLHNNGLDSVGYKEVLDHLDGHSTLKETIQQIKQNTRRFAKKQMTWFRHDRRIQWIDVQEPVDWDKLALDVLRSSNLID
jgi:tRNA dimethylallyltransferase